MRQPELGVGTPTPSDPWAALRQACARRRIAHAGARLLHHYSNAIFHLPDSDMIARVTDGAGSYDRLVQTQHVVSWLVTDHHFPATTPAGPDPVRLDRATVTFWRHHQQPDPAPPLTSRHLGQLLTRLHSINEIPPSGLDTWTPLASLDSALHDPELSSRLPTDDRAWLHDEVARVRDECGQLDSPLGHGLIHGDAWAGNLLWSDPTGRTPILGDWDWVAYGPREIDLIPTWHAVRRYGREDQWTHDFIDQYGYDLSEWPGFKSLLRMRDLVQLTGPLRRSSDSQKHQAVLRHRLDAIRSGDTATWPAL